VTAARCFKHGEVVQDAVAVGAIERMTGPPFMVYACAPCIETHRILLLDDHPADSVGNVRYRRGERETTSTS